uniref:Protein phosphatase 1 regulatory subunit 21 N-terminal domain-containing protein n=1 Tax=Athene cunicularia TaxID=194338 RepID=A0A663MEE0_ATHCN
MELSLLASLIFQLRAQNQVLKKGVVDEQANSASLKVISKNFVLNMLNL